MHSKEEGKEKEGNEVAMGQGDYFAGIVASSYCWKKLT